MSAGRWLAVSCGALLLTGCVQGAPAAISTPTPASPATVAATAPDVDPVSLGTPTAMAAEGIEACAVRKYEEALGGIGILAHARLLPEYVPLTGREPEVKSDEPVFVALFSGTIRLPYRGGPGAPAYKDVQNATCAVLDGQAIWWITGPWTDSTGKSGTPEPASLMDKVLPAPLP